MSNIKEQKSKAKSQKSLAKPTKSKAISQKSKAKSQKSKAKSQKSKALEESVALFDLLFEEQQVDSIEEMPIQQFKRVGDWERRSSFSNAVDRKLLTSPKAVEKIHKQWEKTPFVFDMYLVNDPRVNKSEFRERGLVDMSFVRNEMKLTPEEIPDENEDAITIIFTNNVGAERYMASGWILAHRLGHALQRGNGSAALAWKDLTTRLRGIFANMLNDVYGIDVKSSAFNYGGNALKDKILKYVAQQVGTMKSARDEKLRNWYEFAYELLAQYLLTGEIKFKELPRNIVTGIRGWGHKDTRFAHDEPARVMHNASLESYAEEIKEYFEDVLRRAVGSVFVM